MSEPYLGEIRLFSFNFAPRGWAFCQGQTLPINQNQALFALLGTTYGGNGQTTFSLPNLAGRAAISSGQGLGLSPHNLGESAGSPSVTLTINQIPAHNHNAVGTKNKGSLSGNPLGTRSIRSGRRTPGMSPRNTLRQPAPCTRCILPRSGRPAAVRVTRTASLFWL